MCRVWLRRGALGPVGEVAGAQPYGGLARPPRGARYVLLR